MMICNNSNRSYASHGIPDDTSGITYRSSQKRLHGLCPVRLLVEFSAHFQSLPNRHTRVMSVDSWSAHKLTPEMQAALRRVRTEQCFLPACGTDLVQPTDSFVIYRVKAKWRWRRGKQVMDMISNIMSTDTLEGLGCLVNHGKQFFCYWRQTLFLPSGSSENMMVSFIQRRR